MKKRKGKGLVITSAILAVLDLIYIIFVLVNPFDLDIITADVAWGEWIFLAIL